MTRVLITGVGGQDGTLLSQLLLEQGQEVHGLVLPGHYRAGIDQRVHLHTGDLSDGPSVARVVDQVEPQVIYNLGGISSVGRSWDEPALTGQVSGQGAVAVFEAARRLHTEGLEVAVIQASSAEVFGSPSESPQTEATPLDPVSPYGAAKAYAQQMGRAYRSQGLPLTSLILYSHESVLRPPSFVTRKITQGAAQIAAAGGGELRLGNLAAVRDWGWAPDYVRAMKAAADALLAGDPGTEYVVATGVGHTVADFARAAFAAVGIEDWEAHVRVDPRFFRPVDPTLLIGDGTKIRTELRWEPSVDFGQLVANMALHDLEQVRGEA